MIPYGAPSRAELVGDPFLGFLAPFAGAAIRKIGGKIFGRAVPKLLGAGTGLMRIGQRLPGAITPSRISIATGGFVGGQTARTGVARLGRGALALAGAAGAGAGLGQIMRQGTRQAEMMPPGYEGAARRRIRRMNVLNPKALGRATRRLKGFHNFATQTAMELRKLSPAKPCRPRKKICR